MTTEAANENAGRYPTRCAQAANRRLQPGRVGVAESHGCVRLTNWDAARVAALVKPGTPVVFR